MTIIDQHPIGVHTINAPATDAHRPRYCTNCNEWPHLVVLTRIGMGDGPGAWILCERCATRLASEIDNWCWKQRASKESDDMPQTWIEVGTQVHLQMRGDNLFEVIDRDMTHHMALLREPGGATEGWQRFEDLRPAGPAIPGRAQWQNQKQHLIAVLMLAWQSTPELRLGQLIVNIMPHEMCDEMQLQSLFTLEDDKLLELLQHWRGRHS